MAAKTKDKNQTPAEAIKYINSDRYKMSFSQLNQFQQSPRHLIRYLTGELEFGAPALFSRKFHVYKLEGLEAFHRKYIVVADQKQPTSAQEKAFVNCMVNKEAAFLEDLDDYNGAFGLVYSTKNKSTDKVEELAKEKYLLFKLWIELQRKLTPGVELVTASDFKLMQDLDQVFNDDLDMVRIFEARTFTEHKTSTVVTVGGTHDKDPIFKMPFTCRLDGGGKLADGTEFIFDLKILADALTRKVLRRVVDDYLYVQAGLYSQAGRQPLPPDGKYYLLVLDKNMNSNIVEITRPLLNEGIAEVKRKLLWFRFCKNVNGWGRSYNFFSDIGDGTFQCNPPWWMNPDG